MLANKLYRLHDDLEDKQVEVVLWTILFKFLHVSAARYIPFSSFLQEQYRMVRSTVPKGLEEACCSTTITCRSEYKRLKARSFRSLDLLLHALKGLLCPPRRNALRSRSLSRITLMTLAGLLFPSENNKARGRGSRASTEAIGAGVASDPVLVFKRQSQTGWMLCPSSMDMGAKPRLIVLCLATGTGQECISTARTLSSNIITIPISSHPASVRPFQRSSRAQTHRLSRDQVILFDLLLSLHRIRRPFHHL
jgi:hypothetical protein